MMRSLLYIQVLILLFFTKGLCQGDVYPVAKFSFNDFKDIDEVTGYKIKMPGVNYTDDRFGNENSALYLFGNESSYLNLGVHKNLKSKVSSISLWVKIENEVWAGSGRIVNPFILTKARKTLDFNEAYCLGYYPETKNVIALCTQDSTNQIGAMQTGIFKLRRWNHLVLTYNNKDMSLYINGKLEISLKKGFETSFDDEDSVLVGNMGSTKNRRFLNAIVDDIEFFDQVLSASQVEKLYNAPNPKRWREILKGSLIAAAVAVLLLLVYFFVQHQLSLTLKKEKQQLELSNKLLENELRINRALMNPHFIFNSLNTLHNYILTHNTEKASDYLLSFSKLVRKILESNMSDIISLELEIELIDRYLEVESARFKEDIRHEISVDPKIVPSIVYIPIMMVQPFIENSVWHGLLDKKGKKVISVTFSLHNLRYVKCVVEDNGTGRKIKDPEPHEKKSLATIFARQRLELLNKIHNLSCSLQIIDKPNNGGTIVEIILPILKK